MHRSSHIVFFLFVFTALVLFGGCSAGKENLAVKSPDEESVRILHRYESTFNPSDYDLDVDTFLTIAKRLDASLPGVLPTTTSVPETLAGFRIQALLTQDIDEAGKVKSRLEEMYPDEWIYIVFDSPYYKVRVGNFQDRISAGQLIRQIQKQGFADAWIVPDNVIKNPGPPLRHGEGSVPSDTLRNQ